MKTQSKYTEAEYQKLRARIELVQQRGRKRRARQNRNKKVLKELVMASIIILLVMGGIWSFTKDVQAAENFTTAEYQLLEDAFEQEVSAVLMQNGIRYAGISMTGIYQPDENCVFTVKIHHAEINRMTAIEQQALLQQLQELSFGDADAIVQFCFNV